MGKVYKIEPKNISKPTRKRVAAYARTSEDKGRAIHSLATQISYYNDFIQHNPEWEFAGVYADGGFSGTGGNRSEFQRMIADCEKGLIDIILCKSISRFARNTVDLLETVRHLKELGIEVHFEKEHINSISEDGELMLTLLASFSQEESRSISENIKWSIQKKFKQGRPNSFCMYGYRWDGETFIVVPEEAEIVRLIYDNFLNGISPEQTEKQLAEMGVKSYTGGHFSNESIRAILRNEKYTGNMLLQKEYTVSHITHKSKKNDGELPQYWVENSHEAIISLETFQAVQEEIARRRKLGALANPHIPTSCFTSKLKCAKCGRSFRKHTYKSKNCKKEMWTCRTKDEKGKSACNAENVPQEALIESCCAVLGIPEFDEKLFTKKVEYIKVHGNFTLEIFMTDGTSTVYEWKFRSTSKKDSWTDELREQKRQAQLGVNNNQVKNPFTGMLHCPICGGNFRRQKHHYADGTDATYWHCSNDHTCENKCKITEIMLRQMICEVLDTSDFDEEIFKEKILKIDLSGNLDRQALFHFKDGTTVIREWQKPRKRGVKHSEETKAKIKAAWARRKANENN